MFSIIIPCYNEEKNIWNIIDKLLFLDKKIEIIVVDDCSIDNSSSIIQQYKNSWITHLQNEINIWKSWSLFRGVQYSSYEAIIFLDADLKNFEIESIIKWFKIFQDNDLDMLVFRRSKTLPRLRLLWLDIILSGERILKKTIFKSFFDNQLVKGFQIELCLWKYAIDNNLKIWRTYAHRYNTYKFEKKWFIRWILDDYKMYSEINVIKNVWYKQHNAIKDFKY